MNEKILFVALTERVGEKPPFQTLFFLEYRKRRL